MIEVSGGEYTAERIGSEAVAEEVPQPFGGKQTFQVENGVILNEFLETFLVVVHKVNNRSVCRAHIVGEF